MARPFKGEDLPNPELPPIGPSGIDVNTLEQTAEPMSIAKIEEVLLFLPDADSQVQQPQKNQGRNLTRQPIPRSGTEIFPHGSSRGRCV